MILLEEMFNWGWGWDFEASKYQAMPRGSPFLLPVDPDVELSVTFSPCLPACCRVPCHDANGLNLRNCKQASAKCFLFQELLVVMVSLHSNRTPMKTTLKSNMSWIGYWLNWVKVGKSAFHFHPPNYVRS